MMLRLNVFGGVALLDESGAAVVTQRRRLAVLTLLASAGERGLTREKLSGLLWPDSPAENARHSLQQLLYYLRQATKEELFLGTDPIRLNPELIGSDLADFESALARGDFAEAVSLYQGQLLDGFFLSGSG